MKFIKLALISAVVLFLLVTALASLLPSHIRISRAINIRATPQQISARLADFKSWKEWNEYVKALAQAEVTADSIHAPELSIVMKQVKPGSVETVWHQQRNGKKFPGVFNLITSQSVTTVQWYFEFHFKWYPWEKFSSITYDKQIGPQMEASLENLRKILE